MVWRQANMICDYIPQGTFVQHLGNVSIFAMRKSQLQNDLLIFKNMKVEK